MSATINGATLCDTPWLLESN